MASDLHLYGDKMATSTMRAELILKVLDVPYTLHNISLRNKENKLPEHLDRQPFGKVPALKDTSNGLVLFESRCLMRYIANKYGGKLYGEGDIAKQALVDNWLDVEANTYSGPVSGIVYEIVFKPIFMKAEPDMDRVEKLKVDLDAILDVYDKHLHKNKYLSGDDLSLSDLCHIPSTHYLIHKAKYNPFEYKPYVQKWWDCLSKYEDMISST